MVDIKQIADEAEVIIDGYAFSKFEGGPEPECSRQGSRFRSRRFGSGNNDE